MSICLAVIPARGGSKRVPRKNVRDLCGKPAIAYTIEAARKSGVFSRIVVSTDDDETARIAKQFGAEVPFRREASLADDYTPVSLVTLDTLKRLDPDGNKYKYVAQLMANCPLRNAKDIEDSYQQFTATGADVQISVTRYGWLNPWWAMTMDNRKRLNLLFEGKTSVRSQDLPEVYCPTGAIWWAKAAVLRREETFHIAERTGWEMPWQRAVDIDTGDDWRLAEILLRERQKFEGY
jgi:N-acylneuraminate cytidylyltransferase